MQRVGRLRGSDGRVTGRRTPRRARPARDAGTLHESPTATSAFCFASFTAVNRHNAACGDSSPEVTLALATKQAIYGFVTVRYQWELAARTTTEGAAWNITASFPLKPIRIPQP